MFRYENSVLKCCVCKAKTTFQVVNSFYSYDSPVGIATLIMTVFAKSVGDIYNS